MVRLRAELTDIVGEVLALAVVVLANKGLVLKFGIALTHPPGVREAFSM
jgi:hypothetical protein